MNRGLPTSSGFINSPNPDGPVDHDVSVLRVEDADGQLKAVLFGYACHATTLSFQQLCGDYPGFAQQYIYGTGIPEIYYDYTTGPTGDGSWEVRGNARFLSTPRFRMSIIRPDEGSWYVLRRPGSPAVSDSPSQY